MTAIKQIEKLYSERGKRAHELHDAGKKVIGYFCCFVPDEIITAFGHRTSNNPTVKMP